MSPDRRSRKRQRGLLERWKSNRLLNIIIGLLLIFAGLDLFIVTQKDILVEYAGILLFILGIIYLLFIFLPYLKEEYRARRETLAHKFLRIITLNGVLQPYFPLFGVMVVAGDLMFNYFLSNTAELLAFDTIVLMFGAWLIIHNFVPRRFEQERDFVFIFSFFLIILLVLPLLLLRFMIGDYEASVDFFSAGLLVPPVVAFIGLFGVQVTEVNGINISFLLKDGTQATVGITTSCSGIFSAAIFASAFVAFIFIEFRKPTWKVGLLLVLGVFASYLANILRMGIIMLSGYYYDTSGTNLQTMLFAHANVGWIIFLLWVSLFWALMYFFLIRGKREEKEENAGSIGRIERMEKASPKKRGVTCGICGDILTVDVPGYRCDCGKFYHRVCIADAGKCRKCKKKIIIEEGQALP